MKINISAKKTKVRWYLKDIIICSSMIYHPKKSRLFLDKNKRICWIWKCGWIFKNYKKKICGVGILSETWVTIDTQKANFYSTPLFRAVMGWKNLSNPSHPHPTSSPADQRVKPAKRGRRGAWVGMGWGKVHGVSPQPCGRPFSF